MSDELERVYEAEREAQRIFAQILSEHDYPVFAWLQSYFHRVGMSREDYESAQRWQKMTPAERMESINQYHGISPKAPA